MNPFDTFDQVFNHIFLFSFLAIVSIGVLYFLTRSLTPAGYFDPFHFVWTFTFGTSYALVMGLFLLGFISLFYLFLIFSAGGGFILLFIYFANGKSTKLSRTIVGFLYPKINIKNFLTIIFVFYIVAVFYQINTIGFGVFTETNRFEQARGNGAVVRFLGAITPFIVATFSILIYQQRQNEGRRGRYYIKSFLLILFILFNGVLNGSKIGILTYLFSAVLGIALYSNKVPSFQTFKIIPLFIAAFIFALFVQSIDLGNQRLNSADARYVADQYFGLERLFFRVIANGDQYYMGLPYGVVDEIKIDNVAIRFLAPMIGSTNLSKILDYSVNDFDVGRQIMLYHSPNRQTAGGPTSHFDLFAYKYFGLFFMWGWIAFTSFFLAVLVKIKRLSYHNIFISALGTQLWQNGLSILLEPPIGVAKVLDVIIIFFIVKVIIYILPKKSFSNEYIPRGAL